ncbi:MAG: hypothetical protein Q9162_006011 [Coniocarpon cinnabarinum]
MAHPEVHHLFHGPISDHSFSADRSTLAVARDTVIQLYSRQGSNFTFTDELKGHDKRITGIDIAPRSGKIVTCSQDRNAYVWESTSGVFKPTLVLLRINRAATCVRWSPSETKFAVGSGARLVSVCYFESENDWWVSKHLKKPIRSTVTCLDWHPNSVLLAAGSTDGHARVLSSFIKGVDERPEPSSWGERLPFNTICGEYLNNTAGWVHDVAFSPDGNAVAFASHDASVTVVYPSAPEAPPKAVVSVQLQCLPLAGLLWSKSNELIAAGYDCEVFRLQGDEQGWSLVGSLEGKKGSAGSEVQEESARNLFRQMDLKGKSASDDTKLKTVHQNTIDTIRVYEGTGNVRKVSTSGVDGRVAIWAV